MSHVDPPPFAVRAAVAAAVAEDLTPLGDVSAALVSPDLAASAACVVREQGVLAGTAAFAETFRQVDPDVAVTWLAGDGHGAAAGETVGRVEGPLHSVLTGERTALNFLGHLSGIATLTARYVAAAGGNAGIWDTRKTTPGLRSLEKAAVRAGGGANHRGNLSDWIMLKDNHLTGMGITEGVAAARTRWPGRTVHVECDRLDQVREALAVGADALLLDNMSVDQVAAAVAATVEAAGRRPLLEVSGGVTLETVADYAATGVDMISVGRLTNSAPALDIALDIADGRA